MQGIKVLHHDIVMAVLEGQFMACEGYEGQDL